MHPVRIGCSGWSYDDWRGGLYPDGLPKRRWLERYAEVFLWRDATQTVFGAGPRGRRS